MGASHSFRRVAVTAHDVLQPGVVTALDALISLTEEGSLSNLMLTWYERIAGADPMDSFWVERMDIERADGSCVHGASNICRSPCSIFIFI